MDCKFKVGDLVRIIELPPGGHTQCRVGDVKTVTKVEYDAITGYKIWFIGRDRDVWFRESRLEKVMKESEELKLPKLSEYRKDAKWRLS